MVGEQTLSHCAPAIIIIIVRSFMSELFTATELLVVSVQFPAYFWDLH